MQLYLLRHGIAEDTKAGSSDEARALTGKGRDQLQATMKTAARAGVKPSFILTSPLARALETAEIAKQVLGTPEELVKTRTLVPDGEPQLVWAELSDHRTEPSVMLVSHNPLIEQLTAFFLNTPTLQFDFAKGALVSLEIGNFRGSPDGVLQWILTADLARA